MIRVVVFDAYGTLFDVYSVAALAEQLFPGQGQALSVLWRDKQIEYSRLISLSDPSADGSHLYQDFWSLTERALAYACARLQLPLSADTAQQLLDQYAHLQAFPENLGVLQTLQQKGIPCAILSNGSPAMLQSAVQSAGFTPYVDRVLSVDAVRQFKTHPASYDLVQQTYPVDKAEVLFVSSNGWDALGATWYGFSTFWVNRQQLPHETIGPRPTHTGSDLTQVLKLV
jgi:2-haloacid dehalogenase